MQEFLSISLLIILAAISPGPDFALVTRNSLFYSRKAGIYTALGISLSLLIHTLYCLFGLALLIANSMLAFSIIKYLGAGYLIYIGIKGLLSKAPTAEKDDTIKTERDLNAWAAFNQGLLCNLLNPKAIMFLLAFFTLVVKPGDSLSFALGYGIEIAIIHMLWFSALAVVMTYSKVQARLKRVQFYLIKAMGGLLVAFGLRVATLSLAE